MGFLPFTGCKFVRLSEGRIDVDSAKQLVQAQSVTHRQYKLGNLVRQVEARRLADLREARADAALLAGDVDAAFEHFTKAADYLATRLEDQARWEQLEPDGYPPLD